MSVADVAAERLVCPACRGRLRAEGEALACPAHGLFGLTPHGYFDFIREPALQAVESTSDAYAEDQRTMKARFYREFLRPYLYVEPVERVLEVGAGLGMEIGYLLEEGREAYAVDLPCLSPFWRELGCDPAHFIHADGAALPFPDGFFDAIYTLGVIEHIGTVVGHYTLREDYQAARQAFADELLRVTRPGGRMLVTCPNKAFPIDLAHEPTDAATPQGALRLRRLIYDKTGMTLHLPWGRYHLLSHNEVGRLFCGAGRARSIEPVPSRGYFSFQRLGGGPFGALKGIVAAYVNNLPRALRATPLNPFVIVQIRK